MSVVKLGWYGRLRCGCRTECLFAASPPQDEHDEYVFTAIVDGHQHWWTIEGRTAGGFDQLDVVSLEAPNGDGLNTAIFEFLKENLSLEYGYDNEVELTLRHPDTGEVRIIGSVRV